ncbi:tripartite motif-containing protein 16-like [Esox lucius]|uniref:Tripartite motif-containing protein 16-like n=1 Tax=Esox lucius TaxID=8010 RepID=A0AAY5LAY8_ESOLU|nr:tripartite motif-containing protein 16-like [Esox lucius]
MAEAIDSKGCSICQDLMEDPVTIPCGHSYCMSCIKACLDQEDDKGIYSCPQCRQTFIPTPVLNRSTTLVDERRFQRAPPPYNYAAPGDVECDFCTGRKLRAVKSCLVCLVSFCKTHLQPHNQVAQLKKHKLVQASSQLQEKNCSNHDKLLEVYCHTDQQCICYLCTMDDHKGHDTVSAAAERTEKQKQLGDKHQKSQKRIQEREKEIQELRQAVDSLKHSAQAAVEDSERIFTDIICSIERRRSELIELIRAQEKAEVSRAEGLLEQLEQEVAELRRRDVELNQLSHTEDHIHFLQSFQSLCVSHESKAIPSITVYPHISFEHVNKLVSEMKDQLQDVCKKEMDNISWEVTAVEMIQPPHPKTREDFLTYSCQLTLDPNTACQCLCLSEGNRKVTWCDEVQSYPDHPDRFIYIIQVLCREGLSGVCYWEVEWSGERVSVAVSYKGISRKGGSNKCLFGYNDQSWMLYCSTSSCCLYHNKNRTDIPVPRSSRVGVYLDHRAGTLSFYSVSDAMTLLYRVQTTFTQPLYLGFTVYKGTSVKILTPIHL